MSDTANPAPEGAAAPQSVAPTVSILDAMGDADFGKPPVSEEADVPEEPEEVEIEAPEPEGDDEEIPAEGENEEPADDAAEPEPKEAPSDDDETGTRMHRLRDGTQVSLGDLKKAFDEAREFRRVAPQIQAERARLEQDRQAMAAQHQQFQPVLAQVATMLQQQIVPRPDPTLREHDPIEYFTQLDRHNESVQRLQSVNAAQAEAQQRAAAQQQAQQRAYLQDQQQKLAEAIPALRDPEKAKAFSADFHEVGRHVGFQDQELGQVYDHRLFKLAELAAYGLKAKQAEAKSKAQTQTKAAVAAKKVADVPPVTAPAARQGAGIREASAARGAMDRLKKTGSARDAEDVLSRFL